MAGFMIACAIASLLSCVTGEILSPPVGFQLFQSTTAPSQLVNTTTGFELLFESGDATLLQQFDVDTFLWFSVLTTTPVQLESFATGVSITLQSVNPVTLQPEFQTRVPTKVTGSTNGTVYQLSFELEGILWDVWDSDVLIATIDVNVNSSFQGKVLNGDMFFWTRSFHPPTKFNWPTDIVTSPKEYAISSERITVVFNSTYVTNSLYFNLYFPWIYVSAEDYFNITGNVTVIYMVNYEGTPIPVYKSFSSEDFHFNGLEVSVFFAFDYVEFVISVSAIIIPVSWVSTEPPKTLRWAQLQFAQDSQTEPPVPTFITVPPINGGGSGGSSSKTRWFWGVPTVVVIMGAARYAWRRRNSQAQQNVPAQEAERRPLI
jgi:hypothetical protein